MRTTLAPLILLMALTAGCAGQSSLDVQAPQLDLRQASYNPLAPSIAVPALDTALSTAQYLQLGGYRLTALSKLNATDAQLLAGLRLKRGPGDELSVWTSQPVPAASLYLRYDASAEHFVAAQAERARAISLVLEVEPGLLAIGIAATDGGMLDLRLPLARLTFASGAATALRHAATITQDTRSAVRNLTAVGEGADQATLQWSERHTGDYDLNGEVNISDLTPLGANFRKVFTTSDADYATLEVIDGDENGELNIADLSPIGANFRSIISGYDVYRTPLTAPDEVPSVSDTGRWTKVENAAVPAGPSAPREWNSQDFRLVYTFLDQSGVGNFGWYVVPVNYNAAPESGPASNVATVNLVPPNASLSFEIQPPAGPLANVNDEFYLAVLVNNVSGLFSANVRFEYDSTLVQYLEGVPSFTGHDNLLTDPLFISANNVGTAASPYVLVGFNATEIKGTPAVDGSGALAYIKFKCIGAGVNAECFRFPQSTSFIYLWGTTYGVPVATPELGQPQILNVGG